MTKFWTRRVFLFGLFKLNIEDIRIGECNTADLNDKSVTLKDIRPLWRPFCKVVWDSNKKREV